MGSYGNLARRAVETEMPIMVKVIKEFFFCLSLGFDMIWNLRLCFCVFRCRNCYEELRMLCLWLRFVFHFCSCFQCLFCWYSNEFVCVFNVVII